MSNASWGRTVHLIFPVVEAYILERRPNEVYVHYANTDKRLDEWVLESKTRLMDNSNGSDAVHTNGHVKKRKRSVSPELGEPTGVAGEGATPKEVKMSEEEYDIEHHKQITARRNFDRVNFGRWQIKTWYVSRLLLWPHRVLSLTSLGALWRIGISRHTRWLRRR